jgi:hypothetical protein
MDEVINFQFSSVRVCTLLDLLPGKHFWLRLESGDLGDDFQQSTPINHFLNHHFQHVDSNDCC